MGASADQEKYPLLIAIPELKKLAVEVAEGLRTATEPVGDPLRASFIEVRSALFQRGIYDPVLGRFDTASAPKASPSEIADQLTTLAESL
jgi:hypothetical protein